MSLKYEPASEPLCLAGALLHYIVSPHSRQEEGLFLNPTLSVGFALLHFLVSPHSRQEEGFFKNPAFYGVGFGV